MHPPDAEDPRSDDEAWAEVVRRWADDDAHRDFLSRRPDLQGLAAAGRRYKAVLDLHPADAVAQRWRDEVLRRATTLAFAQLPRTSPPAVSPTLRRALIAGAVLLLVIAVAWVGLRLTLFPVAGSAR